MLSIGLGADTRHASTKSTLSVVCKKKKKEIQRSKCKGLIDFI